MKFLKILFVSLFLISGPLNAQESVKIDKSTKTVQLDGKKFYVHEVKKGHTLYSIAKTYQVELEEILRHNPGAARSLEVGEELNIPVQTEISAELKEDFDFFYHVSRSGETFQQIADIYEVRASFIEKANSELNVPLKEGQYVKIPVVEKTSERKPGAEEERAEKIQRGNYFDHVVKKGETLYGISRQYKVEIEDIVRMNPNLGNSLEIGRVLRIPSRTTYPETSEPQIMMSDNEVTRHQVKSGENIYRISLHYGISVDTIKKLNPGIDESRLRIGQVIRIPVAKINGNYIIHKVKERQTNLQALARRYNLEPDLLKKANPAIDNEVYIGQIIKIPSKKKQVPQNVLEKSMMDDSTYDRYADLDSVICMGPDDRYNDETFKVALFVPLYLEGLDSLLSNEVPERDERQLQRALRFLQFYEGFMIAADTLKKKGMNLEVFVYDVNTDIQKTVDILEDPAMREMDLIVGPFFSQSFFYVSSFAQAYGINIINPFTSRSEVVAGRSEVFKAQPSQGLLPEQIKAYIDHYYPGAKIILIKENAYQYRDEFSTLKEVLSGYRQKHFPVHNTVLYNALIEYSMEKIRNYDDEEDMLESIPVENELVLKEYLLNAPEDTTYIPDYVSEVIYMNDSLPGLKREMSVIRKNVLITISEDKSFILDLLANLNVMRDSVETHVIGLPDWNQFIDFEPELFMNMDVQIVSSQLMDYNSVFTKGFIKAYRDRYHNEPGVIASQGYDLGYYFLTALFNYGDDFEDCLKYHQPELTQNQFVFRNDNPEDGYENIYWYFYNFRDYKINREVNPFITNYTQQRQREFSHAKNFFE